MYIVQLYKEYWAILCMLGCKACSPEQLFQLSSANNTQTIGKCVTGNFEKKLSSSQNADEDHPDRHMKLRGLCAALDRGLSKSCVQRTLQSLFMYIELCITPVHRRL